MRTNGESSGKIRVYEDATSITNVFITLLRDAVQVFFFFLLFTETGMSGYGFPIVTNCATSRNIGGAKL